MNIKIQSGQHKQICQEYLSGKSSYKLAEKYGVRHVTIDRILHKNNIKIRGHIGIYTRDISFFKVIDSEEKAYFLGLLFADGYNSLRRIVLSLQIDDIELVKQFKEAIEYTGKIKINKKRKSTHKDQAVISITNKEICKDLEKLGCVKAKSLILKFPTPEQVPDYLIHHFIRGYFDGDGCIHIRKDNKQPQVIITSSEYFCQSLKGLLKEKIGIDFFVKRRKITKAISIVSGGNYNARIFFDFIYKDATVFLKRKHNLFLKVFKIQNKNVKSRYKNKFSKFFGVTKYTSKRSKNQWTAKLNIGKKRIHIGCFATEIEAAEAYNKVAKEYGRPLNNLLDKDKNEEYYMTNRYINN